MSMTSKLFGQSTLPPGARLRAAAALLACMLALAAIALCPLSSEKAYADQRPTLNIGPVVVTAPAYTGGELLPIELRELTDFPKGEGGAHFAEDGIDKQASGISDIRLEPGSGVVIPIATEGGIAPSGAQFDTIKIKVTGMAAYADSTIEIKVYFRPKLTIHNVAPLNGQYDPQEHGGKKFPGYARSNTPPDYQTYLDGINATYTNEQGDSTLWTKSWTYAYRHRIGEDLLTNYPEHIPSVSPYQTYSPAALGSGFTPETPINAGSYQLVISTPYVQQATAGQVDPAASECAGWIVLNYDVAKAPWRNVRHNGLTLNDESGAKDTANILGMGNNYIPDNIGKASFTVANDTYIGLQSATIDNEGHSGELTVIANGKANSTTLVDEVVVNVIDMRNYEDFTVTVPVTYRTKPQASGIKGVQAVDGTYTKGMQHAGYTGTPTVTYQPYDKTKPLTTYGDDESETFVLSYVGIDGTDYGPTDQAPIAAGSYAVTLSLPLDVPLTGEPLVLEFTVAKAAAPALDYPLVELLDRKGETAYAMPSKDAPDDAGSALYKVKSFTENGLASATIDPATGELTLVGNGKAGTNTDTVTVAISMGNYKDATVKVPVTYTARPQAVIAGVQAATDLVYNGAPQAGYTGTPSANYPKQVPYTGPFNASYSGTSADGTAYGPTDQAPAAAGDYTVTFSLPDTAPCVGSHELYFEIAKAPLTFLATDASMTAGGSLPTLGYTVQGLVGADRVVKGPALKIEGDTSKVGTYTITITGGTVDNQASYQIGNQPGTLTVNAAANEKLVRTGDNTPVKLMAAVAGISVLVLSFGAIRRLRKRRN